MNWMNSLSVSDVLQPKRLIFGGKDDTISSILTLLKNHNITSVPIFDGQKLLTFVSTLDLLSFIAFDVYFKRAKKGDPGRFEVHPPDLDLPIHDLPLFSLASQDPSKAQSSILPPDTKLPHLLHLMSTGVHRVIVKKEKDYNLISQSDMIKFIGTNMDQLPNHIRSQNLIQLGLVSSKTTQKLVVISDNHSAIEGFRKMYRQGVSGLAIVDPQGAIVGTLSSTDIRDVDMEKLNDMAFEPTLTFLKKAGRLRPVVCCQPGDVFPEVVKKLIEGRIHRIWVVQEGKLSGVVTITDLLAALVNNLQQK